MPDDCTAPRLPLIPEFLAELRESCPFFDLVALSRDAVVSTDEHGRVVLFNQAAENLLRVEAEQVLGRPVEALAPPWLRAPVRAWLATAPRESFTTYTVADEGAPAELIRADGSRFLAEVTLARNRSGDRHLFTAMLRDVTTLVHQRDSQRLLAEAGEVFATSAEAGDTVRGIAGVLVRHLGDWCIIYLGDGEGSLVRSHVASRSAMEAEALRALLNTPVDVEPWQPVARVLETGQTLVHNEPEEVTFAGSGSGQDPVLQDLGKRAYLVEPLRWDGRIRGAVAVLSDARAEPWNDVQIAVVRELAQRMAKALHHTELHEQIEREARLRETILRLVVHDLGTPLASASLALERALKWPLEQDRRGGRRYLAGARRALAQITRLVHDLRDIRTAGAGALDLEFKPVDLTVVAHRARQQMRLAMDSAEVVIDVQVPPAPLVVSGDADRLLQLLLNLLSNAVRASPPGVPVQVVVDRLDGWARVSVVDQGPGVPPDERRYLFDRLAHPKPPGEGRTGLGLTIARLIVEAHGGRIDLESGSADTRFWFTVPLDTASDGGLDLQEPAQIPLLFEEDL